MKRNKIACAVAAACALCMTSSEILAQSTPSAEAESGLKSIEIINVTGTHIKGVDLEGAQPLTVIDAETIQRSGAATIAELMSTLGQTRGGEGSFTTAQSGATSTSTPAGQAAASLRGMGPASTLTLINGRRVAASSFASGTQNFVDINSIPLAAIDRIDVLATGASATYGADAVAGVINYVLKRDFKGAELNASYGNSTASSDESKTNINFIYGLDVAKGNLTVFADVFDRSAFKATDRSATRSPLLQSSYSYLPKNTPNIYYYSAQDGNEIGNPDCASPLVTTEFGEQICAYYGNEDDYLDSPMKSYSAGFMLSQEVGDLQWNTDFFYSKTQSTAYSSPAPINQVDDSEGPWADETALNIFPPAIRDALLDAMYIDPFDTIAGRELYGFEFDARFGTPRTIDIDTQAFRLVSSLAGTLGEWDWESAITLSQSRSEQLAVAGVYNRYQYHAALAGELCADGSIADYNGDTLSCGTANILPMYNPFLQGDSANDALLAMTQAQPTRDGKSTVYAWDMNASGDLIEFNGQWVKAAMGLEIRREKITDIPSENARARFNNDYLVDVFGFGSSLSEASRSQWGAFTELYVPLTEQVQLQLAGRYDHYSDFGGTFNPKVALSFRPSDDLILRASWATSFRAPSLTQAGVQLRTTTAAFDCSANQAVADLYCEGDGSVRGNNVLELGNPNLQAEESDSISFGFSYSPGQRTNLTMDYWYFDHKDIVDTDMTALLDRAIDDASLRFCGLVPEGKIGISYDPDLCLVTDTAGLTIEQQGANLTQILDAWVEFDDPRFAELPLYRDHVLRLENTGNQKISGVDVAFDHQFQLANSTLTFALDATHYLDFDRNKPGSDEIESLVGTWRYPQDVASVSLFWDNKDYYLGLSAYYTSAYDDDIERLRGREIDELLDLGALDANEERQVSAWTTVRASAAYFFERTTLRLTIDNLLDRDAPVAYGSSRGFDSYNHNANGTTYNLAVTYSF
jgi:iron complex outermembrane recepter protein